MILEKFLKDPRQQSRIADDLAKERGFYKSATVAKTPGEIFLFCQNKENVEKVLEDLPLKINNFFDLTLVVAKKKGPSHYEMNWENRPDSKVKGTLSLILKKSPFTHGTLLTAEAVFENFQGKGEEASNLMNIFLKRLKSLLETGEIPTTKGQPSGREELKQRPTLH